MALMFWFVQQSVLRPQTYGFSITIRARTVKPGTWKQEKKMAKMI